MTIDQKAKFREHDWAKSAVADLVAGCTLNAKLVKAGFWHRLIEDMTTEEELQAYAVFIIGCKDAHDLAKRVEGFGKPKTPPKL
jgi:hypothetical protein